MIGVGADGEVEVEIGECDNIYNKFRGGRLLAFPIPLDLILRRLRNAAKKAGVSLPKQFTAGPPESDAFKTRIAAIEDVQRFTNMRGGVRKRRRRRS